MNKTGRTRGEIYGLILHLARLFGQFTPDMLTPALTHEQARMNCSALARQGRLRRIRVGTPGRAGSPPLFARAR